MAKLDLLLGIEGLLESYDGLKVKESFMTDCFRACVETQVEKVNDKLNRLLTSKTKLSCRNVLTANFETMIKPDHWLKSKLFKVLPKNESLVLREKIEENHKYRLYTIRMIISKWAPPNENLTSKYIENVCRLTGIAPDEPIGIPSDQPARWMALGIAMAIQENGTDSLDRSTLVALLLGENFAMLRGWGLCRDQ